MTSHKRCNDCGEEKPLDEFFKEKKGKHGVRSVCKPCSYARSRAWTKANTDKVRGYKLKYKYGITVEQFDEMYEKQGGKCIICGTAEATHVDHCHDSGEVRALLCHNCNTGLGQFKDNPELLQAAIEYLEVYNERELDAA